MYTLISHYGRPENTLRVDIDDITLWYSYTTVVAFYTPQTGKVVCENVWGSTTGKHLNEIDGGDKKSRVNRDTFLRTLDMIEITASVRELKDD